MRKRKWTDAQLIEAVKTNHSIFGVLRQVGLKLSGGSHALIKLRIRQMKLDTSHFTGQGWCKGEFHIKFVSNFISIPLKDILVKDSTYQNTHALKKKLIKAKLLEEKCHKCQLTEWLEESISLQLHHIDGDRCNNLLCNLTLLCPNCHSQTPNYCGKHKIKLHSYGNVGNW